MAAKTRVSWNIQGKALHIGVDSGVTNQTFRIGPNLTAAQKAEAFRQVADLLDPQDRPAPLLSYPPGVREAQEGPQELPQQVAAPYPALAPTGLLEGPQDASPRFLPPDLEMSKGQYPDGTPIRTPLPQDPVEAANMIRLARKAKALGMGNITELGGEGGLTAEDLPEIEARPKAQRHAGLDSKGLGFLPPASVEAEGGGEIRERPDPFDPGFRWRDTR